MPSSTHASRLPSAQRVLNQLWCKGDAALQKAQLTKTDEPVVCLIARSLNFV
jgi:hypothetical protein